MIPPDRMSQNRQDASFDDFVRRLPGPAAVDPERVDALIDRVMSQVEHRERTLAPHLIPDVIAPTIRLAFPLAALALGVLVGVQLIPPMQSQTEDYSRLFASNSILQGNF